MANEAYRPNTAQDLIKMYNLDALITDRKQTKASAEKIKVLEETSNSLKDFAEEVEKQIEDLEKIADGKITTYYYSGVPTLTNFPANEWALEDYENHVGDMYYDKETGYAYKFLFDNELNEYLWRKETNPELIEALAKANNALEIAEGAQATANTAQGVANSAQNTANNAQTTANQAQTTAGMKMQVFVDKPDTPEIDTPYPPYQVGDLWLKDDKTIYRCRATKTEGEYDANDWKLGTDFTNDDYAKNVEEQLNVYKEVVATDYVLTTSFEETKQGFEAQVKSNTTLIEEAYATLDGKFADYAPKTTTTEIEKSVKQIQTDTYTKTDVQKIVTGSFFDDEGNEVKVTKVETTSGKFDEDGMHYAKTDAPTNSTINYKGLTVEEGTESGANAKDLLYAGYVDQEKIDENAALEEFAGQSVVYSENSVVNQYFVLSGISRMQKYSEEVDGETKTGVGFYYIG